MHIKAINLCELSTGFVAKNFSEVNIINAQSVHVSKWEENGKNFVNNICWGIWAQFYWVKAWREHSWVKTFHWFQIFNRQCDWPLWFQVDQYMYRMCGDGTTHRYRRVHNPCRLLRHKTLVVISWVICDTNCQCVWNIGISWADNVCRRIAVVVSCCKSEWELFDLYFRFDVNVYYVYCTVRSFLSFVNEWFVCVLLVILSS